MGRNRVFWGWFVVVGTFFVLALNYGSRYSFGVLLPAIAAERDGGHFYLALAASLNMLVYACGNVFTGRIADALAPRWLVTFSALLLAACFFLLPFSDNPLLFCLVYGVIGGLGASGMGIVVCAATVGKWFVKKRGLAMGLATMGIGVGTAVIVPIVGFIEAEMGWRMACYFLGAGVLLFVIIPAQFTLHTSYPEDAALLPDGGAISTAAGERSGKVATGRGANSSLAMLRMVKSRQFILIAAALSLAVMAVMAVFVLGVSSAISASIEKKNAALAISSLSAAGLIGQVFFGWLSDRLRHPRNASVIGALLMALGLGILAFSQDTPMFAAFALIFGIGYGSLAPMAPILIARIFGRERMGAIHGALALFLGAGGALGPIVASSILQATNSYAAVWLSLSLVLLASAFLFWRLKDGENSGEMD